MSSGSYSDSNAGESDGEVVSGAIAITEEDIKRSKVSLGISYVAPAVRNPYELRPLAAEVLDEDQYQAGLERIIERDYFPDVEKHRMRVGNQELDERTESLPVDLSSMTLSQFQHRYISEQTSSFRQLHESDLQRRAKSEGWIEDVERLHNIKRQKTCAAIVEGDETMDLQIFAPFEARNPLLFPHTGLAVLPSTLAEIRTTSRHNTRFENEDALAASQQEAKQSKLQMDHKRAQDDRTLDLMIQEATFDAKGLKKLRVSAPGGRQVPSETPSQPDADFLRTPMLEPGVTMTPLMTWGEIASTPVPLEEDEDRRFAIQEQSIKEKVGQALADKAKKSMRQKLRSSTPHSQTPQSILLRAAGTTPISLKSGSSGVRRTPHVRKSLEQLVAAYGSATTKKKPRPTVP